MKLPLFLASLLVVTAAACAVPSETETDGEASNAAVSEVQQATESPEWTVTPTRNPGLVVIRLRGADGRSLLVTAPYAKPRFDGRAACTEENAAKQAALDEAFFDAQILAEDASAYRIKATSDGRFQVQLVRTIAAGPQAGREEIVATGRTLATRRAAETEIANVVRAAEQAPKG